VKLPRRKFLHMAVGSAALPVVSRTALAQAYPVRTITVIVPFAAGGATDVTARIFAGHMSRTLGQQLRVENVVGAGGHSYSATPRNRARLRKSRLPPWRRRTATCCFTTDFQPDRSTLPTLRIAKPCIFKRASTLLKKISGASRRGSLTFCNNFAVCSFSAKT
jgi:hypothetical protein